MKVVDKDVVGGLQLVVAEVPLGRPGELAVGHGAALGHSCGPDVQAGREQRGVEVLVQVSHPRSRAGGVRELREKPGPLLHLGKQIDDVDPRCEAIELRAQPHGCGVLVERIGTRQLQTTGDEAHAVARVHRRLQPRERLALLDLKLTEALVGIEGPTERDGELVAFGVPARGGHEEAGWVGVAATDRSKQLPGAQRVAGNEPQPEFQARALDAAIVVEDPGTPRLGQQLDALVDESATRVAQPLEHGEQLVVGARRADQLDRVEDGVHRRAQVAVAAPDLVELLQIDRRKLLGRDAGRGLQALKADLGACALDRQLAGRGAFEQDDRQAPSEERELVALARGAATLLFDAPARASVGEAQQLVEEVKQLVAALDHERVQQHEHERVPACGLQPP